jgi:hypothetical protein
MKVFNLRCDHGHMFEGWFRSHAAFDEQHERDLIQCPYCDSRHVEKALSAPRLNLSASGRNDPDPAPADPVSGGPVMHAAGGPALAAALKAMRDLIASSEDVSDRFAEEARAMHAGEAPMRTIHGHTSAEVARELASEGIPVVAIPFAGLLKTPLQ